MPFCPKCGTEVSSDAVFCPKCGAQVTAGAAPSTEIRYRGEKREKEEKEEKREKGEKHEKGEPGDKTGPIVGGLILIWLGITFYMTQSNYITWLQWPWYFLIGIGVVLLIQAAIRFMASTYRGTAIGSLIGGIILLIIGLAGVSGIRDWWWLFFIGIGIVVIIWGITAARRSPRP